MKNSIILVGVFIFLMGTTAWGEEKLLTDRQLDAITAGTGGDGVQQSLHDNSVDNDIDNVHVQEGLDFGSPDALNVVNVANSRVDNSLDASQNVLSKNEFIILKDNAQENAKAVNIVNSVETKIGNALNVHVTKEGLFNGSLPDSGSLPGNSSLNNLYQINIITNSN